MDSSETLVQTRLSPRFWQRAAQETLQVYEEVHAHANARQQPPPREEKHKGLVHSP